MASGFLADGEAKRIWFRGLSSLNRSRIPVVFGVALFFAHFGTYSIVRGGAMLLHVGATTPRVAQRGTTVDVTIQGICLKGAREVCFYKPGIRVIAIEALPDLVQPISLAHGGRIVEQVRCTFQIDEDCVPGEYPFRIRTATEISSLGTFHVTPFRIIDENEEPADSNNTMMTAMPIPSNVTVRGRMGSSSKGDLDVYRIEVRSGERLCAEVDSVRIADVHYGDSEYDLAVRILDQQGTLLARNDDNPLHLQDPIAAAKIQYDGFAYVVVERSLFKPYDKDYCIHIGTFRRPQVAYPAGGQSGTTQEFELLGDPTGPARVSIAIPDRASHPDGMFEYFGDAPSALALRTSSFPNQFEDASKDLTAIEAIPIALNGRIDQRGDIDRFQLFAKRGDRFRVRVFAATISSPIDPVLRIKRLVAGDVSGEVEIEADDCEISQREIFGTSFRGRGGLKDSLDPSIIWEPKNDGEYAIEIADMSGAGGPSSVYRIELEYVTNSVHTVLTSTAFDWQECIRTSGLAIPKGNRWTVNVSLPQGQGSNFRGALRLIAKGLPRGVSMVPCEVPAGRSIWPIQFVADSSADPCCSIIHVEAQPVDGSEMLESRSQQAIPFINHSGGDAWRTVRLDRFLLAVTDQAPFSIVLRNPAAALVRGGELAIPVMVQRREGFHEPIEFQCDWVPPGLSVQPAVIVPGDQSETVLRISADANAPIQKCPIVISATTVRDDLDAYLGTGRIRVSSNFVSIDVAEPFVELASQPESVRRGERKQYAWSIHHKSPFEGSATVRLLGLPKGVRVIEPLPIVDRDSRQALFQIEATDEALLGAVNGIGCELIVNVAGQEIRQRTGKGTLRIDPKR